MREELPPAYNRGEPDLGLGEEWMDTQYDGNVNLVNFSHWCNKLKIKSFVSMFNVFKLLLPPISPKDEFDMPESPPDVPQADQPEVPHKMRDVHDLIEGKHM